MDWITDTNVWIDLHRAKLIDHVFKLAASWISPDVVVRELLEPDGEGLFKTIGEGRLKVVELDGSVISDAVNMGANYQKPSRVDLLALACAKDLQGILLSGDAALRKAASKEGVECHGTIWIVDQLVNSGTISRGRGIKSLDAMVAAGSHLPAGPIESRREKWSA